MEYLLVIALLFTLLIPGISIYYSYSQSSLIEISTAKVADIGNSVINNAENSYYLGQGSRITLDVTMPMGITNLTINCKTDSIPPTYCELIFKMDNNEIVYSTDAPLKRKGSVSTYPQSFDPEDYSAGIKKIIIETYDYVEIDIQ